MDQLVVVLIVGAAALVKWLVENRGKFQAGGDAGEETPDYPVNRSVPRRPARPLGDSLDPSPRAETDEEKMRRFMEALGLPPNGVPPPAQRPRPVVSKDVVPPVPRSIVRQSERPAFRPVTPAPAAQPASPTPAARRSIAAPLETGGPLPGIPKSRPMSESAPAVQVTSFAPAVVAAAGASVVPAKRQEPFEQLSRTPDLQGGLREQLGNPAALRRAILLREILGEPKGLQSLESPSIFSPL